MVVDGCVVVVALLVMGVAGVVDRKDRAGGGIGGFAVSSLFA